MSEGSTLSEIHSSLLNLPAYVAHEDFQAYVHWAPLDGRDTANQLVGHDDNPVSIVIVGQIMQGRLAVAPLGNYQAQEDRRSYEGNSSNKIACKDAKMVLYLRRPTSYPDWIAEYDMATTHLDRLQEVVATSKAPRMWFLEQIQRHDQVEKNFIMKFNHALWQKKQISGTEALYPDEDDDDDMKDIREGERDRAQATSEYANLVSDRFKTEFNNACNDHHIRPPPVFLANGRQVNPGVLEARLPEALVEVVFTLRHFHIGGSKGGSKGNYGKGRSSSSQSETHTFTASIEHVKILQSPLSKTPLSSPMRMKVLPKSPAKGKGTSKRSEPEHPEEYEVIVKKHRASDEQSASTSTTVHNTQSDDETESSLTTA